MSSRAVAELDFFPIDKHSSSAKSQAKKLFHRRKGFRDIQGVMSKINPELLKTMITSASVNNTNSLASHKPFSVPSTPKECQNSFPALPLYTPTPTPTFSSSSETAPLTIFYNGTVTVFDVPRHKAESVLKLAQEGDFKAAESTDSNLTVSSSDQRQLLGTFNRDLPLAPRLSLQRFLQKRKERLTLAASPYGCSTDYAFWDQNTPHL